MITQARLKEVCEYVPATGQLVWKEPGRKRQVGEPIGSLGSHRYLETCIDRKRYLVHRLVWLWHCGEFPIEHTDHINHDRVDNRIENLRAATNRQNNFNQQKRKKKTSSKYRGVSWDTSRGIWKAAINLKGKQKFLGYHSDELSAARAWNKAAQELYGEYANLNSVE